MTRPSSKILSSILVVSALNVTAVPITLRLPLTVRSFPIVTSSGRAIVIPCPDADVTISFAVPETVRVCDVATEPVPTADQDRQLLH